MSEAELLTAFKAALSALAHSAQADGVIERGTALWVIEEGKQAAKALTASLAREGEMRAELRKTDHLLTDLIDQMFNFMDKPSIRYLQEWQTSVRIALASPAPSSGIGISDDDLSRLCRMFDRVAHLADSQDSRINEWLKGQLALCRSSPAPSSGEGKSHGSSAALPLSSAKCAEAGNEIAPHVYESAVEGRRTFRAMYRAERENVKLLRAALESVRSKAIVAGAAFVRGNDDRDERGIEVLNIIDAALLSTDARYSVSRDAADEQKDDGRMKPLGCDDAENGMKP